MSFCNASVELRCTGTGVDSGGGFYGQVATCYFYWWRKYAGWRETAVIDSDKHYVASPKERLTGFDVEYIYGFVWWGVCKQSRWRHSVTEPSQDGGYVLLWQRYDNNKMVVMRYYGNVMTTTRWWLCVTILHLQQYSHRLNLFYFVSWKTLRCYLCNIPYCIYITLVFRLRAVWLYHSAVL